MLALDILSEIAQKGCDKEAIATRVVESPSLVAVVIGGLGDRRAAVRFGCDKILRLIAERAPQVLYPHIDSFIATLKHPNSILRWGSIAILGDLAAVDTGNKIESVLPAYLHAIEGPTMITAANTIRGAARIALAKPEHTESIVRAIMKVEHAHYATPECRNIAIGEASESLGLIAHQAHGTHHIAEFARRHLDNPRRGTKLKAQRLLRKLAPREN